MLKPRVRLVGWNRPDDVTQNPPRKRPLFCIFFISPRFPPSALGTIPFRFLVSLFALFPFNFTKRLSASSTCVRRKGQPFSLPGQPVLQVLSKRQELLRRNARAHCTQAAVLRNMEDIRTVAYSSFCLRGAPSFVSVSA